MDVAKLRGIQTKSYSEVKKANFSTAAERKSSSLPSTGSSSSPLVGNRSYNSLSRSPRSKNPPINYRIIGNIAKSNLSINLIPSIGIKKTINLFGGSSASTSKISNSIPNLGDISKRIGSKLDRFRKQIDESKIIFEREIDRLSSIGDQPSKDAVSFLRDRSQKVQERSKELLLMFEQSSNKIESEKDVDSRDLLSLDLQEKIEIESLRMANRESVESKRFGLQSPSFVPLDLEALQARSILEDMTEIIDRTNSFLSRSKEDSSSTKRDLLIQLKAKQEQLSKLVSSLSKPDLFVGRFVLKENSLPQELAERIRSIAKIIRDESSASLVDSDVVVTDFEKDPLDSKAQKALLDLADRNVLSPTTIDRIKSLLKDLDRHRQEVSSASLTFPSVESERLQEELNLFRRALRTGLDMPRDSSFFDILEKDSKLSRDLDSLNQNVRSDLMGLLSKIESKNAKIRLLESENRKLQESLRSLENQTPIAIDSLLEEQVKDATQKRGALERSVSQVQSVKDRSSTSKEKEISSDILRNEIVELRTEADLARRKLETALESVRRLKEGKSLYRSLSGLSVEQDEQTKTLDVQTTKVKLSKYLKKRSLSYRKISKEILEFKQAEIFDEPLLFREFMQKTTEDGLSLQDDISRLFQIEEDVQDLGSLRGLPSDVGQEDLEAIVLVKNYLSLPLRIQWMIEAKKSIREFANKDLSTNEKLSVQQMKEIELAFRSFFEWLEDTSKPLTIIDLDKQLSSNPKVSLLAKRLESTWRKYQGYKEAFTDYAVTNYRELRARREEFDSVFEYLEKTIPLKGYFERAKSFNVETPRDQITFFGGKVFGTEGFEDASIGFGEANSIQDFEGLDQNFRRFFDRIFYKDFVVSQDLSSYLA